jgi:predicted dehydrogenase
MRPGQQGYGVEPASSHGTLTIDEGGSFKRTSYGTVTPSTYTGFYKEFAAALDQKQKVPVSAEEGANVIKLVELAKKSSDEGRTLDVY